MTPVLRPYQETGVDEIVNRLNWRALLADDMGLGKTVQVLVAIKRHCPPGPIVVVCPSSVKYQWVAEAKLHTGLRAEALEGRTPEPRMPSQTTKMYVLNYEILGTNRKKNTWLRFLRKLKPVLVVLDEVQKIKDCSTRAYQGVESLVEGVERIVATTGTPIENHAGEVWPIANLLAPEACPSFGSWPVFAKRYTNRICRPWGWVSKGSKNEEKLCRILKKYIMIRRRKEDVLQDLPPCTKTVVPFKLNRKDLGEYQEAEADIIAWLRKTYGSRKANRARKAEQMVKLGYLKRLAAMLRLKQSMIWTEEHLEASSGKIVLFGIGRNLLQTCQDRWKSTAVRVDGSVPTRERKSIVERFTRSERVNKFLGNIRAAGVGLDGLQRSCSDVALLELDFNPAIIDQAFGRLDRYGQENPVFAYTHIAKDTIEVKLLEFLQKKSRMMAAILDGRDAGSLDLYDALEKQLLEQGKQ